MNDLFNISSNTYLFIMVFITIIMYISIKKYKPNFNTNIISYRSCLLISLFVGLINGSVFQDGYLAGFFYVQESKTIDSVTENRIQNSKHSLPQLWNDP